MKLNASDFYDHAALEDRLTDGLRSQARPVRFLVGSAISAVSGATTSGVLTVNDIVELIRAEFEGDRLKKLDAALATEGNKYQTAFQFLVGRRGQGAVNNIIKRAVLAARAPSYSSTNSASYVPSEMSDEVCQNFENELDGWVLPPAVSALGELAAIKPEIFGQHILTTNFDPLIGVAIESAGGHYMRTVLHRDGNLGQASSKGCHVVHCHGYWYGSDTLHTPRQLTQDRPRLKASLGHIVGRDLLVVCGYGGWDDVITRTLLDVALDDQLSPEIAWTFHEDDPNPRDDLVQLLAPGIERGRVTLYKGVDCHKIFPSLLAKWKGESSQERSRRPILTPAGDAISATRSLAKEPPPSPAFPDARKTSGKLFFDNYDRDQPPDAVHFVGRTEELEALASDQAHVVVISGYGGQGKSLLAATYFKDAKTDAQYRYKVWRDCREQGDRFERQISQIIVALSRGQISTADLASQPMTSLAELFVRFASGERVLFVFDNIDHYIDLERECISGAPGILIDALGDHQLDCKVVFTCRPEIHQQRSYVSHHRIDGLSLAAAKELFDLRKSKLSLEQIDEVHTLTEGHALWLDLIASQLAKPGSTAKLDDFLGKGHRVSRGDLPPQMLQAVWEGLQADEQLTMRAMAEVVRSSTEAEILNIVRGLINFSRLHRAVSSLHQQGLVVTKARYGFQRLVELHPVLRTFVRRRFTKAERVPFIEALIRSLAALVGAKVPSASTKPTLETLQPYIDMAELQVEAGEFDAAFATLQSIRWQMRGAGAPGEYVRVGGRLLEEFEWSNFEATEGAEDVFETVFEMTARLGRLEESHKLLEMYASTLDGKGVRYIQYCDLQCYLHWLNGEFSVAIEWGEEGVDLKAKSGVDTEFDASHNLALARRDAGRVDDALEFFKAGMKLEDIVDPSKMDSVRAGAFYGNIGRCLQLIGQIDSAMTCYWKSALRIEEQPDGEHVANQAYIRQWAGELFITKGDDRTGEAFLRAALSKWELISPPSARTLATSIEALDGPSSDMSSDACELMFSEWIKTSSQHVEC